jgi:hypothetical protein
MALIQCPHCRRLCFTNAASCPSCGQVSQPGALEAKAVAEEKAFRRNAGALFVTAFLTLLGVLLYIQMQPYVEPTDVLRSRVITQGEIL